MESQFPPYLFASERHNMRVARAEELVCLGSLTQLSSKRWKVRGRRVYMVKRLKSPRIYRRTPRGRVILWECSCPDHADGFLCKHILAVELATESPRP